MPYVNPDNLQLLIHSNTTVDSTVITDSSSNNRSVSFKGAGKHIAGGKMPAGSTCISANELVANRFEVTDPIDFGSNDFVIDFWCYRTGVMTTRCLLKQTNANGSNRQISITAWPGRIDVEVAPYKYIVATVTESSFPPDVWNHVALFRNGDNLYLQLNGVQIGTTATTEAVTAPTTSVLTNGVATRAPYEKIDEIRISTGEYTDFSVEGVPTDPYFADRIMGDLAIPGMPVLMGFADGVVEGAFSIEDLTANAVKFEGTASIPMGDFAIPGLSAEAEFNAPGPFKIPGLSVEADFSGATAKTGDFKIDIKFSANAVKFEGTAEQVDAFYIPGLLAKAEFFGSAYLDSDFSITNLKVKAAFTGRVELPAHFSIDNMAIEAQFYGANTVKLPALRFIPGVSQ